MRKVPSLYKEGQNDSDQPRHRIYIANLTTHGPFLPLVSLYRYIFPQFAIPRCLGLVTFTYLSFFVKMLYKSQVSVTHHKSLPYVRALHDLTNSVFLINLTLVSLISRAPVIEPKREAEKTFFLFSYGCTYVITVCIQRDIDLIYWLRKILWRRPQVTG